MAPPTSWRGSLSPPGSPIGQWSSTTMSWQGPSHHSFQAAAENQQHRALGLNLLVTAIILWNTRYLDRAVAALRQAEDVPDQLLTHLQDRGLAAVHGVARP